MARRLLDTISERTIEVNALHDLATCLEIGNHRVTIIAPTQREEMELGFDDMFLGLPPGRILAIQFKRPHELNNNVVRFYLYGPQYDTLRNWFPNLNEAYYFFTPYTTNEEFITIRQNLLENSSILDIQNTGLIPILSRVRGSRIARVEITNPTNASISNGNRQYTNLYNLQLAQILCPINQPNQIGFFFGGSDDGDGYSEDPSNGTGDVPKRKKPEKKLKKSDRKDLYFIHIQKKKKQLKNN